MQNGAHSSLVEPHLRAMLERLVGAGYARCEPPILQPASIFFDSGEDLRGQLYLTSDVSGADYCLRPEYTIPVSRHYLASPAAGRTAVFSYCGPVFRFRGDAASEFIQVGLESFGRTDREAADAEILALALEAIAETGDNRRCAVEIGEAGLFARLLETLDIGPQWHRRIARGHALGKALSDILDTTFNGAGGDHSGVLGLLQGADKHGARALVEDLLAIAGISAVGGRSPAEIAERFLEQAALKTCAAFPAEKRAIIEEFLAIEGPPDRASRLLRDLATDASLDLSAILDSFDKRLGLMAARGVRMPDLSFATRFTRNLDYYTGFVFEAYDPTMPNEKPIAGGGRYDQLLRRLGAVEDIPAVGAAIWTDRLRFGSGTPA